MRKANNGLLSRLIIIGLAIVFLKYVIPLICNFIAMVLKLKFTDFGFSNWGEFIIDLLAGCVAYFIVKEIFYACSKSDKKIIEEVISILVGFLISIIVYFFIKFWVVILVVSILALILLIIYRIIVEIKNKKKVETENGILQHSSTNE